MQAIRARAALAVMVGVLLFINGPVFIIPLFVALAAEEAGMLLVIPDRVVLVVLLEMQVLHRCLQVLIIFPEARAEPVALGVLLEPLATAVRVGTPRSFSVVDRVPVTIQHLPLQCPADRLVEGRVLEGLEAVSAEAGAVALGPPTPGTVRQISQPALARAGAPAVGTAGQGDQVNNNPAPPAEHLMYRGLAVAAEAAGVHKSVFPLQADRVPVAVEEVALVIPVTPVTPAQQQTRALSTLCQ